MLGDTEMPTCIENSWDCNQNSCSQIQLGTDIFPSQAAPSTPARTGEIDLSASVDLA